MMMMTTISYKCPDSDCTPCCWDPCLLLRSRSSSPLLQCTKNMKCFWINPSNLQYPKEKLFLATQSRWSMKLLTQNTLWLAWLPIFFPVLRGALKKATHLQCGFLGFTLFWRYKINKNECWQKNEIKIPKNDEQCTNQGVAVHSVPLVFQQPFFACQCLCCFLNE